MVKLLEMINRLRLDQKIKDKQKIGKKHIELYVKEEPDFERIYEKVKYIVIKNEIGGLSVSCEKSEETLQTGRKAVLLT